MDRRHNPQENSIAPPSTVKLERYIITELITDQTLMQEAFPVLTDTIFSDNLCRKTWQIMHDRYVARKTIDLVTMAGELGSEFKKEFLPYVGRATATPLSIVDHCERLHLLSLRRLAYEKASELMRLASTETTTFGDLVSQAEECTNAMKKSLPEPQERADITSVVNSLLDDLQHRQTLKSEGLSDRIPTGFPSLDMLLYSGFSAGNLAILAARPSVGKTAVMLQMARTAATAGHVPTIFTLEMTAKELAQRMLVATHKVTQTSIANGDIDWKSMDGAVTEVTNNDMRLYDGYNSIGEIESRIILDSFNGICDIAFIDYLSLIRTPSTKPLAQSLGEITMRLKTLAKSCHIPIVLLCQLNRMSASEKRPPQLYDLKDSGSIEQDADIVLMLDRNGETGDARKIINMWVRKNRQGRAGVFVRLAADNTYSCFQDSGLMEETVM